MLDGEGTGGTDTAPPGAAASAPGQDNPLAGLEDQGALLQPGGHGAVDVDGGQVSGVSYYRHAIPGG